MLLTQCWRNDLAITTMSNWTFADTLHIFRAIDADLGGCIKLQCLHRHLHGRGAEQAHRALDDCRVLRRALLTVAEQLGATPWDLIKSFVVALDVEATVVELSVLI